ncbi:hypothetical protein [Nocardia altamirensis]|uniref:hypothetical protein n=1 Tax=Nocardia altamirensis TaxID=472158 RepID=UPI00114CA74C|nr:hypothetical protein [Nocardia altamirensis]
MLTTTIGPLADGTTDEVALPTYEIPADRLGEFGARIAVANRKLARHGIAQRFETVVEDFTRERTTEDDIVEVQHWVRITLSAPVISYGGWVFVASLDFDFGEALVRCAPGQSLDGWVRPAENVCEHCNTVRRRRVSYVVRHAETGELRQIGSSCLRLFLGVCPAGLWSLSFPAELEEQARQARAAGCMVVDWDVRQVLALAWVISEQGKRFVSAGTARDRDTVSTASTVRWMLTVRRDHLHGDALKDYRTWKAAAAEVPEEVVDGLLAAAQTLTPGTDYAENMRIICAATHVTGRYVALLVSLIAVANRNAERARETAARPAVVEEYLGEPTAVLTDIDAVVITHRYLPSDRYDRTDTLIILLADTGHLLKWKASGARDDIEHGRRYRITRAAVKAHTVYENRDGVSQYQTVITRAKLTALDTEPAPEPAQSAIGLVE